jgi:hypothetical protein
VQLRDESNYIGPTINRTARLRDLAHGGQTVLSNTTSDLVEDRLPATAWLTDLGTHAVRDLPRPERVVQLCHPELRNEFPALRTPKTARSHNLPAQLTSFVGRQAEMNQIRGSFNDNRLVTSPEPAAQAKPDSQSRSRASSQPSSMKACAMSNSHPLPIPRSCQSPRRAHSVFAMNRAGPASTRWRGSSAIAEFSSCWTTASTSLMLSPN